MQVATLRPGVDAELQGPKQIGVILIYRGVGHALRNQDYADGETSNNVASQPTDICRGCIIDKLLWEPRQGTGQAHCNG